MKHFDEMTAFLYLDGQLERAQAAEVLAHTGECAECRALLASLEHETRWLEGSLQEKDAVPARFATPAKRSRVSWGWVIAMAMSAAGIYTVWNGMVEPFQQQLNQAGFSGGNLMTMLFFSGAFWKGWSSVLSFVEFFTVAAFSILVLGLLKRFWRRAVTVGVVLANVLLVIPMLGFLLLSAPAAHAGDMVHGDPGYTLAAGETLNTDLFVAGDSIRIDGTVNGDLFAWGRDVEINGHVTGDVFSFCQRVRINGEVDGNVRAWSQYIVINGKVTKNALAIGEQIELDSKGQVDGSFTFQGADGRLSGRVGRDLMARTADLEIDGSVGGNAKLHSARLHIESGAQMAGSTTYSGHRDAIVDSGAKLASPLVFIPLKAGPTYSSGRYWWHRALLWGAAFLFGLVLILLLPGFFIEGVRASRKFLPALGLGVVTMIATPIVAIIVCITIVGIGVGIATILIYAIALYASQTFVSTWIGDALLGKAEGTGALLGRLALGLVVLHGLELLPYHAGSIVKLVALWWGLGAIAIAIYRHLRHPSATPVPVAMQS
ncbi:MAG TPA: zf-HC2 domain-containing protein [Candidatus Acidoferrales bacterium]|nr:zf-HC2 domain-containing protein [Candidatus Acidoferrales bacterium]